MSLVGLLNYFDQKRGQEQYGRLIDEYRVPGDPNALPIGNNPGELDQAIQQQQGGFRGQGGLLSGGPPPEFFLRAGALPGYQQMAQQAQVGQQAMERQQQQQGWDAQNMSLAQKVTFEAQAQRDKWTQERQEFEYTNMSAAQKASNAVAQGHLGISQQQLGLQQQEFQMKRGQAQMASQFPALGLSPEKKMEYMTNLSSLDQTARIITDAADYLGKTGVGGKGLDRGNVNAMQAEYRQNVIPYFQKKFMAGALQKGDMEFIETVAGNPGEWTSLDANQQKRLQGLLQTVNDDRNLQYSYAGAAPPPVAVGQSAWSRSASSKTPKDIKWGK